MRTKPAAGDSKERTQTDPPHRRLPRSGPAAPSSPSAPLSALPSTSSRRGAPSAPRPAPPPAPRRSRSPRRRRPRARRPRRRRRPRSPPPPPRARVAGSLARWAPRARVPSPRPTSASKRLGARGDGTKGRIKGTTNKINIAMRFRAWDGRGVTARLLPKEFSVVTLF